MDNDGILTTIEETEIVIEALRQFIDERLHDPQNLTLADRRRRIFLLHVIDVGETRLAELKEQERTAVIVDAIPVVEVPELTSESDPIPDESAFVEQFYPPDAPPSAPVASPEIATYKPKRTRK